MYAKFFKRLMDFTLAAMLILALLPVYAVLAILVRINMGSPIIFRQERPGRNEKIFCLLKFRSMNLKTDANGNLLPDKERLTPLGNFLRKTSLDELPQFFNVLAGNMSFIGPRPLLPRYLPFYTAEEKRRHNVRPGITGLAQVSGRNNLSWKERFHYDVQYADNVTFLGDLTIAVKTVFKVLKGVDVSVGKEEFFDVERAGELERKNSDKSEGGK